YRRRWRVDREYVRPILGPVKRVRSLLLPPLRPPRLEALERGLLGHAAGVCRGIRHRSQARCAPKVLATVFLVSQRTARRFSCPSGLPVVGSVRFKAVPGYAGRIWPPAVPRATLLWWSGAAGAPPTPFDPMWRSRVQS